MPVLRDPLVVWFPLLSIPLSPFFLFILNIFSTYFSFVPTSTITASYIFSSSSALLFQIFFLMGNLYLFSFLNILFSGSHFSLLCSFFFLFFFPFLLCSLSFSSFSKNLCLSSLSSMSFVPGPLITWYVWFWPSQPLSKDEFKKTQVVWEIQQVFWTAKWMKRNKFHIYIWLHIRKSEYLDELWKSIRVHKTRETSLDPNKVNLSLPHIITYIYSRNWLEMDVKLKYIYI